MAAGYLEYLEGTATAALSHGSLLRLAAALQTTPDLLGGAAIVRSGRVSGQRPPTLDELNHAESVLRLEEGGVGRIVFDTDEGPSALPVTFKLLDGDIVLRTSAHSTIATAVAPHGATVGFELDHIDDALHEGWSVLVHGHAERIRDGQDLKRARALGIEPWSGAERSVYVRIRPTSVTGRRIRVRA